MDDLDVPIRVPLSLPKNQLRILVKGFSSNYIGSIYETR